MLTLFLLLRCSNLRIHQIKLTNEERHFFPISTFGFFDGGILHLDLQNLSFAPDPATPKFMLSLVKHDGVKSRFLPQNLCQSNGSLALPVLVLNFDFDKLSVRITRHGLDGILIGPPAVVDPSLPPKYSIPSRSWDSLPLSNHDDIYHLDMLVYMGKKSGGEYTLYYHNCMDTRVVSLVAELTEINENSYLSAGEMPLPVIYITFSALYLLAALAWIVILNRSSCGMRPHYMMLTVVVLKTLSLLFLALNYFFVKTHGLNEPGLATVFYFTYILKGSFTVATIALLGAGWIFIKHILSPCDKRIFLLLIPLQILANVAYVVIEENQQFSRAFRAWKIVLLIVDLVCCGVLLFPFIHSIRLLQSSPKCDHKARTNLAKLRLFRRFYLLVVCYLYLSRILVYFLNAVLPYQLFWLTVVMSEMITLSFFIITAWCFLPARMNKYVAIIDY